jgi:hypothetical protein
VNVIISGNSDLRVLEDDILHGGIYNFLAGLGFGGQCFGLRMGNLQRLDTGDGRGLSECRSNTTDIQKIRKRY